MFVTDVLDQKGNRIISVAPDERIARVVAILTQERIGAVLVLNADGTLAGVLSERDIVNAICRQGSACLELKTADLMTTEIMTCRPSDSLTQVMSKMTEHHIRHLPVLDGAELVGVISIVDVVKHRLAKMESALRESEGRLGAVIDNTVDGIITIDEAGRIEKFNPAAELMFGFAADEVIGENVNVLMPPSFRDEHDAHIESYLATGINKIIGIRREITGRRKDGTVFAMALAVSEVEFGEGRLFTGICQDITERKRSEAALKEKTEIVQLLHRLAASANSAREVKEAMQSFLDEVCAHTGWPVGHIYHLSPDRPNTLVSSDIWHLDDPERFSTFREVTEKTDFELGVGLPGRVLASGEPAWIVDVTNDPNFLRARLAEEIGVRTGFALPVLVGPDVTGVLEFFTDDVVKPDNALLQVLTSVGTQLGRVIERKRAEEEIAHMANHDALTGLPSLRLGKDRAQAAVARARRNDTMAALMYVDLDGFKAVNDALGHEAGDHVLKGVAERFMTNIRETDTVARIGGDEFFLVLTDLNEMAAAAGIARKLIDALREPFRFNGQNAVVGASIGIAVYPNHGITSEALIKRADEAMYAVKRKGKNNYQFAEERLEEAARGETGTEATS